MRVRAHQRHAPKTRLPVWVPGYTRRGEVREPNAAYIAYPKGQEDHGLGGERLRLRRVEGDEPGPDVGLADIQSRKDPDAHARAARALFGALGNRVTPGADTNAALKIYPLHDAFGADRAEAEQRIADWSSRTGWTYRIFGPDEKGEGWTNPAFAGSSYPEKVVWLYQPADPNGSFRDYAYTLAWRVTHEVAHGQTNPQMTAKYGGQGRRMGRLGKTKRYKAEGRDDLVTQPLSLADGLRALDWEDAAFRRQREILEKDFGVTITDDQFAREYMVNASDAVYRVLTGVFSSPGDWGVNPTAQDPQVTLARAKAALRTAAREMDLDMTEDFR